ncbi:GntR family transcriptional regulator [Muricoccus aerilatus]|uniref:GntR family transcriptional regulator n=1 Tax=Muricoccus aerilatus TaxID=452982 RepID=UPI0005C229D7|nr:GntR family transcriptional regulator [Roseomonas aerilata]
MLDSITPRYEVAYEQIRGMILDGRLRPGETISEVQLAERLQVSRTPVREAVKRLVGQGLLEVVTTRGFRVFRPTAEDVAEVYFLRAAIEGAIARIAAGRRTAADIDAMRDLHVRSREAAGQGDVPALVELNGRFHRILADACGSGRALAALEGLEPLVAAYRRLSLLSPAHQAGSVAEHARLIDLLEAGDGAAAEALMREHIAHAGRRVVEAVMQIEPAPTPGAGGHLRNLDALAGRPVPND